MLCYLVCKMYEDKKIENWNNDYLAQFKTMHFLVSILSQTILKVFCFKLGAYSFTQFLYFN